MKVGLGVTVRVRVAVFVKVRLGVNVFVGVKVAVIVPVEVGVGESVGVKVALGVRVGVAVEGVKTVAVAKSGRGVSVGAGGQFGGGLEGISCAPTRSSSSASVMRGMPRKSVINAFESKPFAMVPKCPS